MTDLGEPSRSDEQLLAESANDILSFEILMERYEKKLLRFVHRISNFTEHDAEEVVQDVFLKVWRNMRDFSGKVKFSSWLYRIAHNETISAFRKKKSRGQTQEVFDETVFAFLKSDDDFVKEFDLKLSAGKVQEVLNTLDEKYKEILILKFLEDKSYDEISDILELPSGTVAARINRAKKMFRETADRLRISFSS